MEPLEAEMSFYNIGDLDAGPREADYNYTPCRFCFNYHRNNS